MPLLVYVAVLTVPGLLLALALGLRGWLIAASAPLLTYAVVAAASSALPAAGIGWSAAALGGAAVALSALAVAVRLVVTRVRGSSARPASELPPWGLVQHAGVASGVILAAVIGGLVAAAATRQFTAVPQIWDAMFHANAIRFIADSGQSDPAALRALNNPVAPGFYYPNAYHVLAATVVQLTGSTVPTVIDVSVAVVPAALAAGYAALVRRCGGRPALAAAAALLSAAFTAFPYDLLPWGTLLPFLTAVALLPAFLALLATLVRRRSGVAVATSVAAGAGGVGLLGLHPSVVAAAVLFAALLVAQQWLTRRPRLGDVRAPAIVVAVAAALGAPLLRASARAAAGPAYDWKATLSPADALGQVVFASHDQPFPQWWLAVLTVLGGIAAHRQLRPCAWLVIGGVAFAGLFVMAAAYEGQLVALLTKPWWNDRWRLAALWTLAAVPLAAGGVVALRDGVAALIRLDRITRSRLRLAGSAALLAALLAGLGVVTNGLYVHRNETRLAEAFTNGPAVSSAEEAAYAELRRLVPRGSFVMNDAYDGSAMMWALDDVRPVFASPVISSQELPTMDPRRLVLFRSFDKLDTDRAVQDALRALTIDYVIVGRGFIGPADKPAPGMRNLAASRHLDLVYSNADAQIYRIDWTGLDATVGAS